MNTTSDHTKNKSPLRIWIIYLLIISSAFLVMLSLIHYAKSPTKLILGEWKESSWEYEMVNKIDTETTHYKKISEEVKNLIGENLVIHKSEVWKFLPNGELELHGPEGQKSLNWKLNGRGHILELVDTKTRESYNVSKLTDSSLVINFDTDLEVRGIAKLTFIKQ
jgi:hypothetical protein